MAGGKYLQQKPSKKTGGMQNQKNIRTDAVLGEEEILPVEKKKGKAGKIALIALIVVLLLIIGIVAFVIIYSNNVLGMMTRPGEITTPTLSDDEIADILGTMPAELPTAPPEVAATMPSESVEPTFPKVVSDQNITNIMVIGNAARPGDTERFSDSNILVSINRETKTITLTSFVRDLRVTIPAYAGHGQGFNRINHVYHLGSYYTGNKEDSMKLMALAMEQNFGIHIDHTVEVDMVIFEEVINLLGGVEVDLSTEEIKYMQANYPYMEDLEPGLYRLGGYRAMCYARMRKVGNGDWDRTERQREIIISLFNSAKNMGIMDLHAMLQKIMPIIITDMTNEEIMNLAIEMIPMLRDLNIVSQRIPYDGTWWSTNKGSEEVPDYCIDANLQVNGKRLRESLGIDPPAE